MSQPSQEPYADPVEVSFGGDNQVKYFLRLFVSGDTRPSLKAMENLQMLGAHLGNCEIEIVDIHENPALAERERIVATPTLLRDMPLPKRTIIGDLSDITTILLILSA
jgi:circadian clock protein KaiB